jgi:HD superfamily phosphohydrolase
MYWQAYLHKTGVVAEMILTKILKRAKELSQKGDHLWCSSALSYFLNNKITIETFDASIIEKFAQLDDYDVLGAIKEWQFHSDFVLSSLTKMIINRDLLKITLLDTKPSSELINQLKISFASQNKVSLNDAAYFVFKGKIKNQAYNIENEPIKILKKDKSVENIVNSSDQLQLKALSKKVTKYYICFPKTVTDYKN